MNIKRYNLALAIGITFCLGVICGQHTATPEIEHEYQYIERWRTEKIIQPVYIEKVYCPDKFRYFESQRELSQWQAEHYLGEVGGWNCVDYALEIQRLALEDRYQMSVELIAIGGYREINHAICSTWIGAQCIFLEPRTTTNWVGGVK